MVRNWEVTSENNKIEKLLLTLATSNFQGLFLNKFDLSQVALK